MIRLATLVFLAGAALIGPVAAASASEIFDDPLFRRCYLWLTEGKGGALIDNLCIDLYSIPPPTLFLCARKIQDGFLSDIDRKSCALVFDEYARKTRAGHLR